MKLLLLALLPALGLACGLPLKGYDVWLDGRCFNLRFSSVSFNTQDKNCKEDGTYLPIIRSQEEIDQFFTVLRDHYFGPIDFWLGLYCDGQKFVWSDGSEATYTNFASNYTCSPSTTERRYFINYDQKWYEVANGKQVTDEYGNYIGNYLICEAPKISSSTCDDFDLVQWETSETCVGVPKSVSNWGYGEEQCTYDAAHLPSIHDQTANDLVLRTAVAHSMLDGVLIGAKKDRTGNYSWTDGTEMDYRNFAPGFPNDAFGDCVAMQTLSLAGQWMNIPCGTPSLPFVCTKTPFYPTNPQPAGCPKRNNVAPGDEIFSPSYPLAPGITGCDYFLVEPNSNKQAEIEISFFESNSCCDHLIVYDGLVGSNVLRNITGYQPNPVIIRAKTNTIRLRWNAESGANVRGFKAKMNIL